MLISRVTTVADDRSKDMIELAAVTAKVRRIGSPYGWSE